MGQERPGLRLPYPPPLLPHEKNYTDANSLYCLRGITSFKIRLDLVLFLFQNKEVRTFQNMVRNYKRKSDHAKYSADNLKRALEAFKTKEMSLRAASKQFGVPRATVQKRLKFSHLPEPCNLGRFKRTFVIEMENQLKQRVVEVEGIFYGVSTADLLQSQDLSIGLVSRTPKGAQQSDIVKASPFRKMMMDRKSAKEGNYAFLKSRSKRNIAKELPGSHEVKVKSRKQANQSKATHSEKRSLKNKIKCLELKRVKTVNAHIAWNFYKSS